MARALLGSANRWYTQALNVAKLDFNDDEEKKLVEALEEIPHLERLRIHPRWPVVLPERVDERLTAWLAATRLAGFFPTWLRWVTAIAAGLLVITGPSVITMLLLPIWAATVAIVIRDTST